MNERADPGRNLKPAAGAQAPEGADTIFIVDGDEAVRDALATSLEGASYSVALFDSAQAFLHAYQPQRRGCLLVELDLPDLDGGVLVSQLLARHIELPAIVMSRRLRNQKLATRLPAGVAGVLEKPFGDKELLGEVRRALQSGAADGSREPG